MPRVIITDPVMVMLRQLTAPGYAFRQTAELLPDGRWSVEVDEDVVEAIDRLRKPGEDDDTVIFRLCANALGQQPLH
jgi:hypothetical protein